MLRILTVCTGNICRSPLAALVLGARVSSSDAHFSSAGTRARDGLPMTAEAIDLAVARGVEREEALSHRARFLTPAHLKDVDMVVAMSREHRRAVVEMDPTRIRMTFTARELARVIDGVDDAELAAAAAAAMDGGAGAVRARFAAILSVLRARRGLAAASLDAVDDDVIDPFGRSVTTYRESATQLDPGLAVVERLTRLASE